MKLSGSTDATLLYDGDQQQNYSNGISVYNWKEGISKIYSK
jgi:hypothetical protein